MNETVKRFANYLGVPYKQALVIIVDRYFDEVHCDLAFSDDEWDSSFPIGRLNEHLKELNLRHVEESMPFLFQD